VTAYVDAGDADQAENEAVNIEVSIALASVLSVMTETSQEKFASYKSSLASKCAQVPPDAKPKSDESHAVLLKGVT
jgi:hypothetical protein